MQRPVGVTILAVLAAIGGVLGILGGLALFAISSAVSFAIPGVAGLTAIVAIVVIRPERHPARLRLRRLGPQSPGPGRSASSAPSWVSCCRWFNSAA